MEGENLYKYKKTRRNISEKEIIHIGIQLCEIISFLHLNKTPILYLDLKPANIIINNEKIKLIDFGSAKERLSENVLKDYYATKGYAAPELYKGKDVDERADIYGIGVVLYFLLSGEDISTSKTMKNIDFTCDTSKSLKRIINRCIYHNPSFRFPTVKVLNKNLKKIYKRKFQLECQDKKISISIAGSQKRVGVTHLSLQIARYFKLYNISCLYEEKNNSRDVKKMYVQDDKYKNKEDAYYINGLDMKPYIAGIDNEIENYDYIIKDFASLSKENLDEYLKSDIKILVLSTKEWEIIKVKEKLDLISQYKDIKLVFNYINGRMFKNICKNMMNLQCYRMPYEPKTFTLSKKDKCIDFISEIIDVNQ